MHWCIGDDSDLSYCKTNEKEIDIYRIICKSHNTYGNWQIDVSDCRSILCTMGVHVGGVPKCDLSWGYLLMIFVTVGSQKFQFDRLLKAIDDLVEKKIISEEVFAQIGYSEYLPQYYAYAKFLNCTEFEEKIAASDLVITHGGTGVIMKSVKSGKKVIAVPRLVRYHEHVDDHQIQLIEQFTNSNLISSCLDLDKLGDVCLETREKMFASYQSNTENIINSICQYIDQIYLGDVK